MDLLKRIAASAVRASLIGLTFAAVSCSSYRNIPYFQDKVINSPEAIDRHAGIVIQPKDVLSIVVTSRTPELTPMFNLQQVTYAVGSSSASSSNSVMCYTVDGDGFIEFPVLGKIDVAGKTRWECADMIKKELIGHKYLEDAVVTVDFMDFKVSILGEVAAPGTYTVSGDKVTLLQALSRAGDLTIYGKRENVSIIREFNGKRVIYEVDLTSADLFNSPAYYLQQNDIIYVEPSKIRQRQSTIDDKSMRIVSMALSSGSFLISLITLIRVFVTPGK